MNASKKCGNAEPLKVSRNFKEKILLSKLDDFQQFFVALANPKLLLSDHADFLLTPSVLEA